MRILVTGAGGVMGRSATRALVNAGHEVVGLVRSESSASVVSDLGGEPAFGDLFDHQAVTAAATGCDAIANLATKVPVGNDSLKPWAWRENDRIRAEGAEIVARAARDSGISLLIQQSLTMPYPDSGDRSIDESVDLATSFATKSVVVAEQAVADFTATGGEGVVLRFALIIAPDSQSAWQLERVRRGKAVVLGNATDWMSFTHPDDVGTAVLAALGVPAGIYNVAAEPLPRGQVAEVYALASGSGLEPRLVSRRKTKLLGPAVDFLARSQRISTELLRETAGWEPTHPEFHVGWFDGVR